MRSVLINNCVPEESKIAVMKKSYRVSKSVRKLGFVGSVMNSLCVVLLAFSVNERCTHIRHLFCPIHCQFWGTLSSRQSYLDS